MFGDEPASRSSRSTRTSAHQDSDADLPGFFDVGTSPGSVEPKQEMFQEPEFDPTATAAYNFTLTTPPSREPSVEDETGSRGQVELSAAAPVPDNLPGSEQAVVDLRNPNDPFVAYGDIGSIFPVPRVPQPVREVDDRRLQGSLFAPGFETVIDVRNPGNEHAFEKTVGNSHDEWHQHPVVWLVGGLFLVVVFFVALLFRDLSASEPPSSVSTDVSSQSE